MSTVTRAQFLLMKEELGGDLWNKFKLCAIAFTKFPDAMEISYCLGTGLYCTIHYITKSGERKSGDIYDRDTYRSKRELAMSPEQLDRFEELKQVEILYQNVSQAVAAFQLNHFGSPLSKEMEKSLDKIRARFKALSDEFEFKKSTVKDKMNEAFD